MSGLTSLEILCKYLLGEMNKGGRKYSIENSLSEIRSQLRYYDIFKSYRPLMFSHNTLVTTTVRLVIINRCDIQWQWKDWIPHERSRSHDAQLVVFSQRNPKRPSAHLIHNKTQQHHSKSVLPETAPLRLRLNILGHDLLQTACFSFPLLSSPVLLVLDFWGWSSVYFHLLPRCAVSASGRC